MNIKNFQLLANIKEKKFLLLKPFIAKKSRKSFIVTKKLYQFSLIENNNLRVF